LALSEAHKLKIRSFSILDLRSQDVLVDNNVRQPKHLQLSTSYNIRSSPTRMYTWLDDRCPQGRVQYFLVRYCEPWVSGFDQRVSLSSNPENVLMRQSVYLNHVNLIIIL